MSDIKSALEGLHDAVATELARRIDTGEASAADMANAIKFLKDNGINADGRKNPLLSSLAEKAMRLPFDEDDLSDLRPN